MALGVIRVTCGANSEEFGNIAGKSVGDIRTSLRDILNIGDGAKALVNGEEVKDDQKLETGDNLEFIKAAGKKG